MITVQNLFDTAKSVYNSNIFCDDNFDGYEFIGIRFEDRDYNVGDTCSTSKHNPNREDERDFPEFDSPEYNDLPDLGGTSAWDLSTKHFYKFSSWLQPDSDAQYCYNTKHCYIIAGNKLALNDYYPDDNEIVIEDAIVLAKIY